MENTMECVLFAHREFKSKEGTPLTEILGFNLESYIFFQKIMSSEDWEKFGLKKSELYYSQENKSVVRLILIDDGFNKKVIGSKLIGEGEFETVLSKEEVDEQLKGKK